MVRVVREYTFDIFLDLYRYISNTAFAEKEWKMQFFQQGHVDLYYLNFVDHFASIPYNTARNKSFILPSEFWLQ